MDATATIACRYCGAIYDVASIWHDVHEAEPEASEQQISDDVDELICQFAYEGCKALAETLDYIDWCYEGVTVLGPNLHDPEGYDFHIHAVGCRDLGRAEYRGAQKWNTHARNLMEVVAQTYDYIAAEELPQLQSGFHVFPCVEWC